MKKKILKFSTNQIEPLSKFEFRAKSAIPYSISYASLITNLTSALNSITSFTSYSDLKIEFFSFFSIQNHFCMKIFNKYL